jgi:hypothetical protein
LLENGEREREREREKRVSLGANRVAGTTKKFVKSRERSLKINP